MRHVTFPSKTSFPIDIRSVKENNLYERFLTFVAVADCTGAGLAKTINENLASVGFDATSMRGQCYDS